MDREALRVPLPRRVECEWHYHDNWLVYTMYRLHIFRGYKNSILDFILDRVDLSYNSIKMAYKNLDHEEGLKGLPNISKGLKRIHQEQGNTSLHTLVEMIHNEEIRERLRAMLRVV
jgi:hypothetical protein